MLYWSDFMGASVFTGRKKIGHIENMLIDRDEKVIAGFILERRNRDFRYRHFPFSRIQVIKRDSIELKDQTEIELLPRTARKKYMQADDILNHTIVDEKEEWLGRVVDLGFDPVNGVIRDIILSGSLVEDFWQGRKRMPVLSNVEFSQELIRIDQDAREEIMVLHKGLKNWLDIGSTER